MLNKKVMKSSSQPTSKSYEKSMVSEASSFFDEDDDFATLHQSATISQSSDQSSSSILDDDLSGTVDKKANSEFDPSFNPNVIPKEFAKRDKTEEQMRIRRDVLNIVTLLDMEEIPQDLVKLLADSVSVHHIDDTEFDLRDELRTQLQMVRAVRSSILNASGSVKESTTVSEVKSVLDASMKLSQMLTKANQEIVNIERIQAVEAAFLEVVSGFPEKEQKEFVSVLERRMKAQKALAKQ